MELTLDEAKTVILNHEMDPKLVLENPDWRFTDNEEPARNKQLAQNPESSEVVFKLIGEPLNLTYDFINLILPI